MFFEICRILYDKRPSMVILENVKGLLNHEGGRTFHRILESLQKLGYVGQWQVLNSKNFGVPQNRERVFIVGYLGGGSGSQIFPIPESYGRNNESHETPQGEGERLRSDGSSYALNPLHFRNDEGIREYTKSDTTSSLSQPSGNNGSLVASTLQGRDYKGGGNLVAKTLRVGGGGPRGENLIELSENAHESRRVYDPNGIAKTIKAKAGGLGAKTGLYIIKKHRKDEIRDRGQVSPTLTESRDHHGGANPPMVTNDIKIRRLTPKECERLQSFPDNYTLYGKTEDGTIVEMSDTQRYKAMGDAVTVNVVEMVAYYLTHELKIDKINKVKSLEEFF